ncbi:hypothetical protein [Actinacidiphila sp. bgisy167]|uniref:hypothetical protein n=1 Tax=Actinacidiphila sp. bgisy167 TaxID=3413797 RepID=UPI003D71E2D6
MRDLLPEAPKKQDWFTQIRNLPVWQGVLVAMPFGLLFIGGAIGGALGALGAVANLRLARTSLAPAAKALSMAGVVVGCVIVYFAVAAALAAVLQGGAPPPFRVRATNSR